MKTNETAERGDAIVCGENEAIPHDSAAIQRGKNSTPETPLDLARRMLAAQLNPYSSCGVTAALRDCQVLAAEVVRLAEDSERLDYMAESGAALYSNSSGWWLEWPFGRLPNEAGPTSQAGCFGSSRAAIDAARKESR